MQRKEEKKRTKFSLQKIAEGSYENSVAEMAKTWCWLEKNTIIHARCVCHR